MNIFKELGKGIKRVGKLAGNGAPLIATLAGGPMAGKLVSMLTGATGTSSFEDALDVIEKHPDPQVLLAQIEAENKIRLQELTASIEVTKNAQNMYKETSRNSDPVIRRAPVYQAMFINISWLVSFFAVLYLSFGGAQITEDLRALVYTGFGALTTELARCNHFFFGSSSGSKDKQEKINT